MRQSRRKVESSLETYFLSALPRDSSSWRSDLPALNPMKIGSSTSSSSTGLPLGRPNCGCGGDLVQVVRGVAMYILIIGYLPAISQPILGLFRGFEEIVAWRPRPPISRSLDAFGKRI